MKSNYSQVIRLLVVYLPVYTIVDVDPSTKKIQSFRGSAMKAIHEVLTSLQIKYTVNFPRSGFVGVRFPNGTWNGMMGDLQENVGDIIASPTILSLERLEVLDYSFPLFFSEWIILGGSPPPASTDVGALLKIFSIQVWIGLVFSMVFLVLVSGISVQRRSGKVKLVSVGKKGFYMLVSFYTSAFFSEGTPKDPSTFHGRFLFGIWWLVMMVISNGFCGHSRAMMMMKKEGLKIRDVDHLATLTPMIKTVSLRTSVFEAYFRDGDSSGRKIWKALTMVNSFNSMFSPKNMHQLVQGKLVFISEYDITRSIVAQKCSHFDVSNLYFSKKPLLTTYGLFGFRKNLDPELVEQINTRVRWIVESHLYVKWVDYGTRDFARCTDPDFENTDNPLTMKDLHKIFLVYVVCLAFSFIVFLLELMIFRLNTDRSGHLENNPSTISEAQHGKPRNRRKMLTPQKLISD